MHSTATQEHDEAPAPEVAACELDVLFALPIESERAAAVARTFSSWRSRDEGAAEAWLEAAALPEFRKEELREIAARRAAAPASAPPAAGRPSGQGEEG